MSVINSLFKALTDFTSRKIIMLLKEGDLTAGEIEVIPIVYSYIVYQKMLKGI